MNQIEKDILKFWDFREKTAKIFKSKPSSQLSNDNPAFKRDYPTLISELKYWYLRLKLVELKLYGCGNCTLDAFIELRNYKLNEIVNKMTLLHKLKAGKVAQIGTEYYVNESPHLTNEICEQIYKRYGAGWFEMYDPNWRDKVLEVNIPEIQEKITTENLSQFFNMKESILPEEVKEKIETIEEANDFTEEVITSDLPDFTKMTHRELLAFAKEKGIKLKSNKKDDIIKILSTWSY